MQTYGFKLISTTNVDNLSAKLHLFNHEKTGAQLIWLERESENKTFCVGYQTLPEDNTGVFHILEHSVLSGSEKYPVKEPFVELLKGSMKTFLNALTFPDKTLYPVSSRNDKDFLNLMHVYLDAMLHPSIYTNPNIFRQEGWHYEFDENGNAQYVGVVYGEMKGAYSSVDQIIETKLDTMLFPDTPYRFSSGGDPKNIPDLTYEHFIDTHKRFYHPSKAKMFLDGSVDIETVLCEIDKELSPFESSCNKVKLEYQKPISYTVDSIEYELSKEESKKEKCHFVLGKVVGTWDEIEKMTALDTLFGYLAGSNSSPLTRKILESGLGQDIILSIQDGIAQPYIIVQVENCKKTALPKLKEFIQTSIKEILEEGLDGEELSAILNQMNFVAREPREPFGLELAFRTYQSWMYGGDPTKFLDFVTVFNTLREKIGTGYFENLINEVFLSDNGMAELYVYPSYTLGKKKADLEKARLKKFVKTLSKKDKEKLINEQKDLARWHQSEDTVENLAKIPHMDIEDVSKTPIITNVLENKIGNIDVLSADVKTNGTVYIDLNFALPKMDKEQLANAALLCCFLSDFPTKNYSRTLLQREIRAHLGLLNFGIIPVSKNNDIDNATCYLRCHCSFLEENVEYAIKMMREVLLLTELNHLDFIKETIQQEDISVKQAIVSQGNRFASSKVLSGLTAEDAVLDAISGLYAYNYIGSLAKETNLNKLLSDITDIYKNISKYPVVVGVTGNIDKEHLIKLLDGFVGGSNEPTITLSDVKYGKEIVNVPAGIAYAVSGNNMVRIGKKPSGAISLATKILSLNYLWNEVRVQGGAYGSGIVAMKNGNVYSYSFRDPNPSRTLDVYKKEAAYLRAFCESKGDYKNLLIGAISDTEPLLTASVRGRVAIEKYLRGYTVEYDIKRREELINASYDDLLDFCDTLEKLSEAENVCVIGGAEVTKNC